MRLLLAITLVISSLPIAATARVTASARLAAEPFAPAPAQSPTPAPTPTPDEETLRLEREKAQATLRKEKAEADKAAAEARKAELEALFPKPTSSPLEGKTTVEGAVIESQMVSYVSMARAANRIVDAINSRSSVKDSMKNLAIYNERDIGLLLSYKTARSQVEVTRQGYCTILTPAATGNQPGNPPIELCPTPTPTPPTTPTLTPDAQPAIPAVAPLLAARSFLGGFIDATSLLRTNVEIKGQTFAIDEGPLVAEVFRAARRSTGGLGAVSLYYPHVFPPKIDLSTGSRLLAELERLRRLRTVSEKIAADLVEAEKGLEEVKANIEQLDGQINQALPRRINESVAASANIIKANCRGLVGEVNGILALPEKPQQWEPMLRLIARISDQNACPRMPGEKLEQLLSLRDTVNDLKGRLAKANQDKAEAEQKKLRLEGQITTLKGKLNPAFTPDDALAQLKSLNTQFDNLIKALVQPDAGGVNPLTNFIRTESLLLAVPAEGGYWLQLKVINAGGNNRIKTNLLVDLFTGGNRVSHSGGAIVQYNLFDSDGRSVVSDTIADYTNYIKAGRVRNITNSDPNAAGSIDENR